MEKMQEKHHRRNIILVLTPVLEDFDVSPTNMMQLWGDNSEVIHDLNLKVIKAEGEYHLGEHAFIKRKPHKSYQLHNHFLLLEWSTCKYEDKPKSR